MLCPSKHAPQGQHPLKGQTDPHPGVPGVEPASPRTPPAPRSTLRAASLGAVTLRPTTYARLLPEARGQ